MGKNKDKAKCEIDLTERPPRSPRVRLGGYVILPRLIDKARAALAGTVGEYVSNGKGLDKHFYDFTGLEDEAFKKQIGKGLGDWDLLLWVQEHSKHKRAAWEIAAWSDYHQNRVVDSDFETISSFAKQVKKYHTEREDIKTRFDLLDLDDYCTFGGKA